jgi:hypothetical protein
MSAVTGTVRFTVVSAYSEAPALCPTPPAPGDVVEIAAGPCAVNDLGTVHQVHGKPWLLTRIHLDEWSEEQLHRLIDLHETLAAAGPVEGVHAFFWYGAVTRDGGRSERVLLETDVPVRTASLRETAVLHLPMAVRLRLASSLAATLAAVAALPATLGRLDDSSIRLDLAREQTVVTGLTSGAFGPPYRQVVLDTGAAAGQLAPELYDADGIHPDHADPRTDAWALVVALHRLLFGCHPFQGLPDLRPDTVARHLAGHGWPGPGTTAEFDAVYRALPPAVLGLFHQALERGWADPDARPAAREWSAALGPWTGPPEFVTLTLDRLVVLAGEQVTMTWSTRYATHVVTAWGQRLDPAGTASFTPPGTGPVRLWAVGPAQSVAADTAAILILRDHTPPAVRPIDRPEPLVPRPEPHSIRFPGRPARARIGPLPRPSIPPGPPAAPRFLARPSRFE